MADVTISARAPQGLVKEIDILIGDGVYKNRTDMIVHSIRRTIEEHARVHPETLGIRAVKEEIMQGYVKKAKGDRRKAVDLLFKDLEKF